MKWTKEKYLDVINNSPLFDIEDKTSNDYVTEYRYLQNKVAEYYIDCLYRKVDNQGNIISFEYSSELMDKFAECIKYYKKENGLFTTYLDLAFNKAVKQTKGKDVWSEVRGGIKIQHSIQKEIRNIVSIARNKGWDLNDVDIVQKLVQATSKTEHEVLELIHINRNAMALSESVSAGDDELNLFDNVADTQNTAEQAMVEKDSLIAVLDKIDRTARVLSPSKLQVISAVLTLIIEELDFQQLIGEERLKKYSFFNQKVYDLQSKIERRITDADIAKMLGASKPYISRVKKQVFAQMGGVICEKN